MSERLQVMGHDAGLMVEVLDYENRAAQNPDDANWLKCRIKVNAPPFVGEFQASFTTHDFVHLANALSAALRDCNGSAEFQTYEEGLAFRVDFRKTGQATVSGTAKIPAQTRTTLSFAFDSDQSFLRESLNELQGILSQFPVKT